jgi:hypothetical protein
MKPGGYGWAFYTNEILIAYYYSPEKNIIQKIFLDGLDYSARGELGEAEHALIDLDFGKAAVITKEGITLLDAVARKHYPMIPLKYVRYAQWSESQHLFVVETDGFKENGKIISPQLHIYQVN